MLPVGAARFERQRELTALLNHAAKAYYQDDSEIMSNKEYDGLYDELLALEAETGTVLSGSPTLRVGYDLLSELPKYTHEYPMLSLDKTKDPDKLRAFLGDKPGLCMWKLDGLAVSLCYEGGELLRAVTRGNGEVGELITHNARVFANVPLVIPYKGRVFVRGEALISYGGFERINSGLDGEEQYKNPRNLVSGTVRQLNSEVCAGRGVMFIAYSHEEGEGFTLKSEGLSWLASLGFTAVDYIIVESDSLIGVIEDRKSKAAGGDYPSDGLVLAFDDVEYSSGLGRTSKFPKDAIAFKWEDETAETRLRYVEWNTSRTGLINPVAVFEPVDLLGSTVERASVHNVSVMEGLELGEGDVLTVYKANMIIPQIAENLTRSGGVPIPEECPVCRAKTEIEDVNGVKSLYCTNPNCEAQLIRSLSHFCSRDAMNIEGLSEKTLERFTALGWLKNYADIYRLHEHSEMKELEGFGERSYEKLVQAVERSKDTELQRFIHALGIKHIGLANAKILCKVFDYDIERIRRAAADELNRIDGFGEVLAESVSRYFSEAGNNALMDEVLPLLRLTKPAVSADGTAAGLVFVITGSLNEFENRNELKDYIESIGGKAASAVSAKTSFLINNDTSSGSGKNKKAAELGVQIISEQEFIERFGRG